MLKDSNVICMLTTPRFLFPAQTFPLSLGEQIQVPVQHPSVNIRCFKPNLSKTECLSFAPKIASSWSFSESQKMAVPLFQLREPKILTSFLTCISLWHSPLSINPPFPREILQNISRIWTFLTTSVATKLLQPTIISRLDCNHSLLAGLPLCPCPLQSTLNVAVQVVL